MGCLHRGLEDGSARHGPRITPVLLHGLVYFTNDEGQVNVIEPSTEFDCVARYEMGEPCYASPAISDGQVFLRGFQHLFCLGKRVE